ncbi:MAG: T9SS type A sorting domain-containing protein [Flavobacteriaceae bacterium]
MKSKSLSCLVFIITFLLFSNQLSAQELWGMTHLGGDGNLGTIFKYNLNTGVYTKLYDFSGTDGSKPYGSLFKASDGQLYGMTQLGGLNDKGIIFRFNPSTNTYTKLIDFDGSNGSLPRGNLIEFSTGVLYGTTEFGGTNNIGVLFEYNISTNTYTKKVDFDTSLGKYPNFGSLIKASNNLIYGTTIQGGAGDGGTLFEYNPSSNTFIKKIDFGTVQTQSSFPRNTLFQASNGFIYGSIDLGSAGLGSTAIFKYDIGTNTLSLPVTFSSNTLNGGFIQTADGEIYILSSQGGANNSGAIYQFDTTSNNLIKKFDFDADGVNTGRLPQSNFMQASNGNLYALASKGGNDHDNGTLFEYNATTNTFAKKLDFVYISGSLLRGWEPTGNLIEINSTALGVDKTETQFDFSLYPNPTIDVVKLQYKSNLNIIAIRLFNSLGSLVKEFKASQTELDMSKLPTGLYILKLKTDKGNISEKIIKE